mmetsp:Transcript_31473/g.64176  ORF Transcript_31473/g.64176 Transcript_31473/m.64176 type:complete len:164 (+) Transcript_31473:215-706(+)
MVGNEQYATDFVRSYVESGDDGLDAGCDWFFSDGDDDVSTTRLCDNNRVDIPYEVTHDIPVSGASESMLAPPEITNKNGIFNNTTVPLSTNDNNTIHDEASPKPLKGKSIAHFHLQAGECVFEFFDIRLGGSMWHCANVGPDFSFRAQYEHTIHQNFQRQPLQ